MRFRQFFFLLASACGIKAWGFDRMAAGLISGSVPLVQPEQLAEEREKNPDIVILDAREHEEYKVSHLESAIWVGYKNFDPANLILDENSEVVVYCSLGYRSEKVAEKLEKAGHDNTRNLYGGIFNWINQGLPLVDCENVRTQKIHPYKKLWGKWLTEGTKAYK